MNKYITSNIIYTAKQYQQLNYVSILSHFMNNFIPRVNAKNLCFSNVFELSV